MKHMIKIPTERKWYRCPYCGKKLLIYEDTAKCSGVYLNCRECKREINIKL
jgi:DNA-directed RNA polymerase subunit RPC12/RpoP